MTVFAAVSLFGFGQSLDDINELMGKSQFKKAKESIDKYMKDPKNANASDGWYFKGRIYNSLSRDSTVSLQDGMQYKLESFNAFKRLQEIDKKDIRLKLEGFLSYFDLYNGFFDLGAKGFNNKDYNSAFEGFKNALQVEEYVRGKGYDANGFKFPVMDTSLILNTANSAIQAKREDDAIIYYKLLIDANVASPGYMDVYSLVANYYFHKNDKAAMDAVFEKAKKFYPAEPYWEVAYYQNLEIDKATKGLAKDELYKKYDEFMGKYPDNFVVAYNYSVDLYKYIYSEEGAKTDVRPYKAKFEEVLKKAITLKSTAEDNFLMANYLYNTSFDMGDSAKKIKGVKPDDIKKKNEFSALSKKALDDCIPYALAAIDNFEKLTKLKGSEKANYRQTLDMLTEIYRVKGDVKKSADYKAKKDALDK